MPQTDFSPENRLAGRGTDSFDKFKLLYDQRARIVVPQNPTFAWVHQLRAPHIVDGRPQVVTKKRKQRAGSQEQESYTTFEMDFIGRPLCLGDPETLKTAGVDSENCPACRRSTECDQVRPPERRFAVNIIRYATDASGQLTRPFSCQCLVWAFNEGTYLRLIGLNTEWAESGGILGRDLLCGPCTSAEFQNFEITPGAESYWKTVPGARERFAETFKANARPEADLEAACGRRVAARWMEQDIDRVRERWAIVDSGGRAPAPDPVSAADQATLARGLDDLLNTTPAAVPAASTAAPDDLAGLFDSTPAASPAPAAESGAVDLDALLSGIGSPAVSTSTAPVSAPTATPAAASAPPAPAEEVLDFDALLRL